MIEQLDRRKNWLLDDPERIGKEDSASRWLPDLDEEDYTTNPRRPQTALERRLKGDNQGGSRPLNAGDDSLDASLQDEFDSQGRSSEASSRLDLIPAWTAPAASQSSLLDLNPAWSGPSLQDAERSLNPARTERMSRAGLDSFSRQRLDRSDRLLTGDGVLERSGSLEDSTERLRDRDLRSDAVNPALRNPKASPLAAALADGQSGPATGVPARSGLAGTLGAAANPYLPPTKEPEPYVSPAARMLKAPPVQPPRFRP